MRKLEDEKEKIYSCSKCGLCQSVCPIYKITQNDCTVSRGLFIMLSGLIKGDLELSKKLKEYLNLCLKCGACSKFCPSDINVVDIIALANAEYFNKNNFEKFISFLQKAVIFIARLKIFRFFRRNLESKKFDKKVIYFGGCKNNINTTSAVIKILNSIGIEVISPDFECCGLPFFIRGDLGNFQNYVNNFENIVNEYEITDIVTTCAGCEETLKSYVKWGSNKDINVKNIFQYIAENNKKLKLNNYKKVTFHKPCKMSNYSDVRWILDNTENLEYVEMNDYDKCCGFNGIFNFSKYHILMKLYNNKRSNIQDSGAATVLTCCYGCETSLKLFSLFKYKVEDLTEFLAKNVSDL